MKKMAKKKFTGLVKSHERWLRGEAGERLALDGYDLTKCKAPFAILRNAVLKNCELAGVDLRQADLRVVDFRGSDLTGADLRGARLDSADFRCAKIAYMDVRGADYKDAYFKNEAEGRKHWPEGYLRMIRRDKDAEND